MGKEHNNAPAVALSRRSRPWRLLRLAFIWARKGNAFKQRLFLDLKNLRHPASVTPRLCERQFSLEDSPAFRFMKNLRHLRHLRRLRFPCISPSVNFDNDDEILIERSRAMKLLEAAVDENELKSVASPPAEEWEAEEEQGIDSRAEKFIMEFYEQMKLQRQISYLEYTEMLQRGMIC